MIRRAIPLVAFLGGLAGPAGAAPWDVPALMQLLANHPSGRVQFTETKTLSVLDKPVVSTGELVYQPPDRLEKHTLKPRPESLVIEGNRLTVTRDGVKRELRLSQYPEVLAFIEALRGTLVGNQKLLQQHYTLALRGSEQSWQLIMTPLDERMFRWVRQIIVSGSGNAVKAVETLQADGDKSLITVAPPAR
ncbi:LolA-related protein [Ottowia sp.]|uniref:LolA-related protein n=1 Tax=Ottowia sp. TaxID=1898956 RepID=UPI0039E25642